MNNSISPSSNNKQPTIPLSVELGGGLELLFSKKTSHKIDIPAFYSLHTEQNNNNNSADGQQKSADMRYLFQWLKDNLLTERPELFIENETIRPGILVLINDTDWDLQGGDDYQLENNDIIVLISSLHGG